MQETSKRDRRELGARRSRRWCRGVQAGPGRSFRHAVACAVGGMAGIPVAPQRSSRVHPQTLLDDLQATGSMRCFINKRCLGLCMLCTAARRAACTAHRVQVGELGQLCQLWVTGLGVLRCCQQASFIQLRCQGSLQCQRKLVTKRATQAWGSLQRCEGAGAGALAGAQAQTTTGPPPECGIVTQH